MAHTHQRTVSIGIMAQELGISRDMAYRLAREDRLPIPVIRFPGTRRMVVSRSALDDLLMQRKEEATEVRS